jgi:hypothetical protein
MELYDTQIEIIIGSVPVITADIEVFYTYTPGVKAPQEIGGTPLEPDSPSECVINSVRLSRDCLKKYARFDNWVNAMPTELEKIIAQQIIEELEC